MQRMLWIWRHDTWIRACRSGRTRRGTVAARIWLLSVAGLPARVPRSALVGEVDEEADAELALDEIVAEPLRPVVH